ncbi:MAG: right-handed parallel beta-helix repeat-containing protein [Verrucomicrobia bacterium]|nr:right-handed parallel beta-helix repeat-containing protein [Verrucomicrobiota bacterium]
MPLFALLTSLGAVAADSPPVAVATFECLGLYWKTPEARECTVQYRREGATAWRGALPLVFDARDGEWRGSIVALAPDTAYEIKLRAGEREATLTARTRRDQFPIGVTTTLPPGDSADGLTITQSGSPQGYHLVTVPAGGRSTIDVRNRGSNLVIDADYVIVRGIELRNAAAHGILIKAGHHDIVVEQCHISGWGRYAGPVSYGNTGGNLDSAIYAERGCGNLTFQRNLIEHPRGAASDWEDGHPVGPQGISLINSTGGNVIRFNDIWASEDHGFNDGIGGEDNFSREGSPNRDSDIHGNFIRNCWDDAIESEGANMNVRIWGNYLDKFYNGIATACVSRGPLYVFRNVYAASRHTHRDPTGGACIKTGEREDFGGGRRFVLHNTALQPGGVHTAFTSHVNPNCVTRNNIFDCRGALTTKQDKPPASDYDYDFFNGSDRGVAVERHGVRGRVAYLATSRLEFFPAPRVSYVHYGKIPTDMGGGQKRVITDPVETMPNPVIDAGAVLPNFNDDFTGKAPDLGAFELGGPPLEFGRRAYLKWNEGWAPWETVR